MTRREALYVKLIEECSEVQKCATKILRFGENSFHPDDEKQIKNSEKLADELADLVVVLEVISKEILEVKDALDSDIIEKSAKARMEKLEQMLEIQKELGFLN